MRINLMAASRCRLSANVNVPEYTRAEEPRAARDALPHTQPVDLRGAERQREKEVARGRLARLVERSPLVRQHIDEAVQIFRRTVGEWPHA